MFRRSVAVGVALGLQCFMWTGAGVHAHLDAHGSDHHDGRVVHSHAAPHAVSHAREAKRESSRVAGVVDLHPPEDGAVLQVDPFVAVQVTPSVSPAPVTAVFSLVAPVRLAAKPPLQAEGGHDPPSRARRPSRAPPLG